VLASASGCDRHPTPESSPATAWQEPHAGDPHVFACDACHGASTTAPVANQRATCTRSGCHPQAWTRTLFHRVEPDVFSKCTNCHKPHAWVADAGDCNSCHAGIHGAAGTVVAQSLPGTPVFPHERHARFACDDCHRVETRHADLTIADPQECIACHHGPPAVASCTACHDTAEFAGTRTRAAQLQLHAWKAPRARTLPFDHARHADLDCQQCHQPSAAWAPADNCASCHTAHHRAEATCVTCHEKPPASAHALEVHTSNCRDCHGSESAAGMQMRRNFCLACHQDQQQHMPAGNCADCHKLTAGTGGAMP
jgi:hypothetical protein